MSYNQESEENKQKGKPREWRKARQQKRDQS